MLLRAGVVSRIYRNRREAGTRSLPDGRGGSREYPVKAQHELVIARENLARFERVVGFQDTDKAGRLAATLAVYRRAFNRERFTATVRAVEPAGEAEVFDVSVPGVNAFDANGLFVHNCGEQPLPPYGSCLLGSVNLTGFVHEPFTGNARFDWDGFRETVAVFTRMLDNVVEINGLPLEEQRREITAKRRHGMGFLGLGSTLALLGLRYGSPESLEFTADVSRELALTGWRTALELAEEKGTAPILEERVRGDAGHARRPAGDGARRHRGRGPGEGQGPACPVQPLHAAGGGGRAGARRPARGGRRPLHPPLLDRPHRHHLALPREQREQRDRAELRAPLLAQRHPDRAQDQGEGRRVVVRASRLPRAREPGGGGAGRPSRTTS